MQENKEQMEKKESKYQNERLKTAQVKILAFLKYQ